jgi:L-ascorbate metabolism protein UlaG (beta-lactamase superfamily)
MSIEITWLGHASVMVKTSKDIVYIDPWKVGTTLPEADIILLTHDHYDHYSEDDINLLAKNRTRIIAPMATGLVTDILQPGQSLDIDDLSIEAVPAYNIDKEFHPKKNNWVGYVLKLEGKKIYHTGDTDHIPEMKGLVVDVALMPVGGTYTMTAEDACNALQDIRAEHVIPIHFGDIVGSRKDAEKLSDISTNNIHILSQGETFTIK